MKQMGGSRNVSWNLIDKIVRHILFHTKKYLQIKSPANPNGHYYSPIVDLEEVSRDKGRIWPNKPQTRGIDFNESGQRDFLKHVLAKYIKKYDYPEEKAFEGGPSYDFFTQNPFFSDLDPRVLFAMLLHIRPTRIIETGSGYSSLLTADVNRRYLANVVDFTTIDPYPPVFLLDPVPGITRVLESRVQDVSLSEFENLKEGDIFFIDSSSVSKTGSDVNHIYFEIVPRLKPGVILHIHDIFFPKDYPEKWVLDEWRNYSEQYLVRALLMFSDYFEVIFGCAYAYHNLRDALRHALGGVCYSGSSFWLKKTK